MDEKSTQSQNRDENLVVSFPAGKPLGITFEWMDGLKVSEVHSDSKEKASLNCNKKEQKNSPISESTLEKLIALGKGDILSSVNGQDVSSLTFGEVVALLRAAEASERILKFKRSELQINSDDISSSIVNKNVQEDGYSIHAEKIDSPVDAENSNNYDIIHDHIDGEHSEVDHCPSSTFKKFSNLHLSILSALKNSKDLQPMHVEVKNESYHYAMRKKLGPKRQMALLTRKNSSGTRWESVIYKMKPREEDYEIVPLKQFLTTHNTRWQAVRHCEAECKIRDANPAELKETAPYVNSEHILSTHFKILVVSDIFDRMPNEERITLIYEAILKSCGVALSSWPHDFKIPKRGSEQDSVSAVLHGVQEALNLRSSLRRKNRAESPLSSGPANISLKNGSGSSKNNSSDSSPAGLSREISPSNSKTSSTIVRPRIDFQWARSAPYGMKIASTFGRRVCDLPIFRFLINENPLELIIQAVTPSQWQPKVFTAPDSERYGQTHVGQTALTLPGGVRGITQKARLRKLAAKEGNSMYVAPTDRHSKKNHKPKPKFDAENLGVDPKIAGISFGKKTGGIYGHFFKDLSPAIKEMVMERYAANKHLIQREGVAQKKAEGAKKNVDSFQPKTTMSQLRKKMELAVSQSDPDRFFIICFAVCRSIFANDYILI